jgi:hypothetical protein
VRLNKQKLSIKAPVPLLFILIGGSILLLAGGFLLNRFVVGTQTQKIVPVNNSYSVSNKILSLQAHALTPTAGHSAANRPTNQPSLPPTTTTGNNYNTLPPGSALPGDSTCSSRVSSSSFEPRPDNYAANHRVPTAAQVANLHPWDPSIGMNIKSDSLRRRITGNFTGTTDEILQWVACKWGVDVNIVRAEAVTESYWHQSQRGDYTTNQSLCPPGTWNGTGCYQSYGILQIKYVYFQSEWPMSRDDTAFNADFVYGWLRNCFEGHADYLYQRTPVAGYPSYHAGDIWGCLGFWFSGSWYDQGAINYISTTKNYYTQKPWLQAGF